MDIILALIVFVILISIWVKSEYSFTAIPSYNEYTQQKRTNLNTDFKKDIVMARNHALGKAAQFLKAYKNPMGDLCLVNKNCSVNITNDGVQKKIVCRSKIPTEYNTIKVLTAYATDEYLALYNMPIKYVVDNLFNLICENFSDSTVYENIHSALTTGMLSVKETAIIIPSQKNKAQNVNTKTENKIKENNLLDINTATEEQLSSLPGVNIVTAKKAVKYINQNGEFTSVDEFIEKMKIKDIFAQQIRDVICTNTNNTSTPQQQQPKTEENLDIDFDDSLDIPHSDNERTIDL